MGCHYVQRESVSMACGHLKGLSGLVAIWGLSLALVLPIRHSVHNSGIWPQVQGWSPTTIDPGPVPAGFTVLSREHAVSL